MPDVSSSTRSPQPGPKAWWRRALAGPLLARRRLRLLLVPVAAIVLAGAFVTAAMFNASLSRQRMAQESVGKMAAASSYTATGVEVTATSSDRREVHEQFTYNAPDRIHSLYQVSAQVAGLAAATCAEQEIIILGDRSYQRCNDKPGLAAWVSSLADLGLFNNIQFRPWERFAWCTSIKEEGTEVVGGAPARVFSCRAPNQREADLFWPATDDISQAALQERRRFIEEGSVHVRAWVRETDGYIARFVMEKVTPGDRGPTTRTLDYAYAEFGSAGPVRAPAQKGATSGATETPEAPPEVAIIASYVFTLEVADDDNERQRGLSDRPSLERDRGMLFIFPYENPWPLWMKDVAFPLDLVFITSDGFIVNIQTAEPQPGAPDAQIRSYQPGVPVLYALEINGGLAAELGITEGMQVLLR